MEVLYHDVCDEDKEYLRGLVRDVSCRLVGLQRVSLLMKCISSLVMYMVCMSGVVKKERSYVRFCMDCFCGELHESFQKGFCVNSKAWIYELYLGKCDVVWRTVFCFLGVKVGWDIVGRKIFEFYCRLFALEECKREHLRFLRKMIFD